MRHHHRQHQGGDPVPSEGSTQFKFNNYAIAVVTEPADGGPQNKSEEAEQITDSSGYISSSVRCRSPESSSTHGLISYLGKHTVDDNTHSGSSNSIHPPVGPYFPVSSIISAITDFSFDHVEEEDPPTKHVTPSVETIVRVHPQDVFAGQDISGHNRSSQQTAPVCYYGSGEYHSSLPVPESGAPLSSGSMATLVQGQHRYPSSRNIHSVSRFSDSLHRPEIHAGLCGQYLQNPVHYDPSFSISDREGHKAIGTPLPKGLLSWSATPHPINDLSTPARQEGAGDGRDVNSLHIQGQASSEAMVVECEVRPSCSDSVTSALPARRSKKRNRHSNRPATFIAFEANPVRGEFENADAFSGRRAFALSVKLETFKLLSDLYLTFTVGKDYEPSVLIYFYDQFASLHYNEKYEWALSIFNEDESFNGYVLEHLGSGFDPLNANYFRYLSTFKYYQDSIFATSNFPGLLRYADESSMFPSVDGECELFDDYVDDDEEFPFLAEPLDASDYFDYEDYYDEY
jgi:hypothetical protein